MISFEDVEKFNRKQRQNTFFVAMATTTFVLILFIYAFLSPSKVVGDSMNPTLENGDIVFSLSPKIKQYERGDIVTIDSVSAGKNIIKRIIGVGGDTVRIETGKVYVNGALLKENYINRWETEIEPMEVKVPKGYIFVLGDNRDVSRDSRELGCISEAEISRIYLFSIR